MSRKSDRASKQAHREEEENTRRKIMKFDSAGFARKSGKVSLKHTDLVEVIAALRFAAVCTGGHVACQHDPYSEHGLTGRSTRIFQLLSALAVELRKLEREEEPGDIFKSVKARGRPLNERQSQIRYIVGAAVVVLHQERIFRTKAAAIRALEDLVIAAGLEYSIPNVRDWADDVAADNKDKVAAQMDPRFMFLLLKSRSKTLAEVLEAANFLIEIVE